MYWRYFFLKKFIKKKNVYIVNSKEEYEIAHISHIVFSYLIQQQNHPHDQSLKKSKKQNSWTIIQAC